MSPPQRSVPRACSRASASPAAARPAAAIIATSTMPRSQPRAARFSGGTAGGQDFAARAMGRRMRTSIAALLLVLAVARAAPAGAATGAFAEAAALPEDAPDVDGALAALRAKLEAWSKVVTRYGGTPWEPAALAEEERLEAIAARLVVAHRRTVEDGTTAAERALRFLIQKHADSKALPGHILHLADFYAELARDYVSEHERPLP